MKILITLISSFLLITVSNFVDAQTTGNTVDLLWEGETYTPTFYAGRSLPSAGSLVRVVAMPNVIQNGQRLSSSQLVFKWVKDQNPIQSASGQGKDILEYRADQGGASSIINVEILTKSGETLAKSRAMIPPSVPKLVLYRMTPTVNPTRTRALTGIVPINSSETTLIAEPFFFSTLDLANNRVFFDWQINGTRVGAQRENPRLFTVVAINQSNGKAKLTVTAQNEATPFKVMSQIITLGFGTQEFNF